MEIVKVMIMTLMYNYTYSTESGEGSAHLVANISDCGVIITNQHALLEK